MYSNIYRKKKQEITFSRFWKYFFFLQYFAGRFEIGRVKQIWQGKNRGEKKKSDRDSFEDDGWETIRGQPEKTKFLITTYWDEKDEWKSLSSLRLVPRPNIEGKSVLFPNWRL